MSMTNRALRPLVLLAIVGLILVFLPVEQVSAEEIAPETKSETLAEIPVESSEELLADPDAETTDEDGATDEEAADGDGPAELGARSFDAETQEESSDSDEDTSNRRERSEVIEAPMPFTGLGFSGPGDEAPELHWRALDEDGEWSDWQPVEVLDEFDGPDPDSDEGRSAAAEGRWVSDAIWVGPASHLQIQADGGALEDVDVTVLDSAGLSESLFAKAARTFRSLGTHESVEASVSRPSIIPRSQWVDTENCTRGSVSTATPRAAVLHHTATTNSYSEAQAPQQVRNMYHWHTSCHGINGNGWNDIGYNFVVDRFGNIYEGRRGGIDRGVIGAHAGGWNTNTFGVAIMGNYNTANPSNSAMNAVIDLTAWKYDIHGIDHSASARTTVNGQSIPTLVGHRNVRGNYTANPGTTTDCPGQRLYTRTSEIRSGVELSGDPWVPVVGDWNGNGQTTVGWFRDGQWRLRNSNNAGNPSMTIRYGTRGDYPIVGDWNGDGRTTIGVVRGSRWLLRNSNSGGNADIEFHYGEGAGDFPMAGDWNGNGRDGPAIIRDREWHLRNSLSGGDGQIVFTYGRLTAGDVPIVGDWNGNGRDTPAIVREREWHLRNSHAGGTADYTFIYGRLTAGDSAVVGDWNGNGQATVGITRASEWHLRNSLSGGTANLTFTYR